MTSHDGAAQPAAPPVGTAGSPAGTSAGAGAPRPPRSARRMFAATILVLEAFLVFFATLVAFGLRIAPPGVVWLLGGVLAVSLILVAGMLRWPAGYLAGSALQVPLLASGLLIPTMFVVAAIFVALWVVGLRLGGRIDRERAEREASAGGQQASRP